MRRPFKITFILVYLLLPFNILASEVFEVSSDRTIEVRLDSGQTLRLGPGALISVSHTEEDGWAKSIQILRESKNSAMKTEPIWAKLGKQSFQDFVQEESLVEFVPHHNDNSESQRKFDVVKEGRIEVLSGGERFYLNKGDSFEVLDGATQSWKKELIITRSSDRSLLGENVVLARSIFNQLVNNGHVQNSQTNQTPRTPAQETQATELELSESEQELNSSIDCPQEGEYRVKKSFFYDTQQPSSMTDELPFMISKDNIIEVQRNTELERCEFVLKQAKSGQYEPLLGRALLTSPTNLTEDSLLKVDAEEREGQTLDFLPGARFIVTAPESMSALIQGESAPVTLPAPLVYDVETGFPHHISLKGQDGRRYLVERSELEASRRNGELIFDTQESFKNSLTELNLEPPVFSPPHCPIGSELDLVELNEEDPIVWQNCRNSRVVGANGRTLLPNTYYDNFIQELTDFGHDDIEQVLSNRDSRELTKCIKESLEKGMSRNAKPQCNYDGNGNLEHAPIRRSVRKINSKGVPYTEQEIINPVPKACASKQTSAFLAANYQKAMKCLDLDPKEMFDLINHESNFQPGAMSPTGALSVGQTIISNYLAIRDNLARAKKLVDEGGESLESLKRLSNPDVYRQEYENGRRVETRLTTFMVSELSDKIAEPEKHHCEDLAQLMNNPIQTPAGLDPAQHVLNTENRRLCPPSQPAEAFLMAGLDYLSNKKYARSIIDDWESKLGPSERMDPEQKEDITQILAKWMYNGGQEGMARSFEYFMHELTSARVTKRDDELMLVVTNGRRQVLEARNLKDLGLEDFKKYMSVHIKQSYSGNERRKTEVAGYIQKMDDDLDGHKEKGLKCTQ